MYFMDLVVYHKIKKWSIITGPFNHSGEKPMNVEKILMDLIKDNTKAMTEHNEILKNIRGEFKDAIIKYREFGKVLIRVEALMCVAAGTLLSIFVTVLAYIVTH